VDLRAKRYWRHKDLGLMAPMVATVFSLMPPIKQSKKLSNLKTWSGAPVILFLLGNEAVWVLSAGLFMLEFSEL
jgi:hypothetical protein